MEIPSKPLLEALDLRHSFVEGELTNGVRSFLKVEAGEITAVVGPSGCGKIRCFIYLVCLIDLTMEIFFFAERSIRLRHKPEQLYEIKRLALFSISLLIKELSLKCCFTSEKLVIQF